uniref:RNA methyltransferase n=1 Tax=Schlesneria paludicola TaxID=360056 RepID=A0A7C4QPV1_9PLAN
MAQASATTETVLLRNPHSVLAALSARPRDVLELRLPPQRPSGTWQTVTAQARAAGVPLRTDLRGQSPREQREQRHGAASAVVRTLPGVPLDALWRAGREESPRLWLALDCLQDPHNVGAIFRTAAFFGVRGIVLTRDRSAPMSGTVYDVASGGVEAVPFSMVTNLAQALQAAKEAGLWLLGSSERAERDVRRIPRDRPWLLIIGNEEHGLRRLTLDLCDEVCGISGRGAVRSLNASVAAGLLIAALSGEM